MFDIAWSEFLIVAVVALVVVGPRDLPPLLRTIGKTIAHLRRMAGDFQSQFNEALREAELDELRRELTGLKDGASKMMSGPDPFSIARDEIKGALESKPAPSALAGEPPGANGAASDLPSAFAPQPELPAPDEASAVTSAEFVPEPAPKPNGAAHPAAGEGVDAPRPPAADAPS